MDIELRQITVRDVSNGYVDSAENGVVGYGGRLNIRPAYQREFVYKDKQRNAVIDTITHNFPLNVMYWCENADGSYELLDGQQRTVSICQYINGDFSINNRFFHNLTDTEKEQILNYKLMIYICNGNDKEKHKERSRLSCRCVAVRQRESLENIQRGLGFYHLVNVNRFRHGLLPE